MESNDFSISLNGFVVNEIHVIKREMVPVVQFNVKWIPFHAQKLEGMSGMYQ